jgi:hypothetical protein
MSGHEELLLFDLRFHCILMFHLIYPAVSCLFPCENIGGDSNFICGYFRTDKLPLKAKEQ